MSLPPEQLWQRLIECGLFSKKKIASLRRQIEQKPSVANSSAKIVRVLVGNKLLTAEQAADILAHANNDADPPVQQSHASNRGASPEPIGDDGVTGGESATISKTKVGTKVRSRQNSTSFWPIVLGTSALLFVLAAAGTWWLTLPPSSQESGEPDKTASTQNASTQPDGPEKPAAASQGGSISPASPYDYVDSPEALWAREAPGAPVELRYAPAEVQASIHIRLAALRSHDEGTRILRSLGPSLNSLLDQWQSTAGIESTDMQSMTIHLLPQGSTMPKVVVVTQMATQAARDQATTFDRRNEQQISRANDLAIWFPEDSAYVVTGDARVVQSIAAGDRAILRREMEQLRLASHDTDHLTILANPNFLRDEASGLFTGTRRRLLLGLYDFWNEKAQAVSLGMQLGRVATLEARMIAREDLPPRRFAALTRQQVERLPLVMGDFLGRVQLDPYWQPLAIRFPAMVRFVTEQTRVQDEGKQVVVNTVLPVEAIHNLLLASELSLASEIQPKNVAPLVNRSDWTMEDVLASKVSIRFSQKSLEAAMQDIAEQMRDELTGLPFAFEIRIVGTDLEPEGITRNQQIRDFQSTGEPLANVLTQLVIKANPVQTVVSPTETDQKLVWVKSPEQAGTILITTRNAAAANSVELPTAFQSTD